MDDVIQPINLLNDIYYRDSYAGLYAGPEDHLFKFEYREAGELFFNMAIKRPIRKIGTELCDEGFYDLETPYGYGGCLSSSGDKAFIDRAMEAYKLRCHEERIVAEFIRFHPSNTFHRNYPDCFDLLVDDRDVVVVDLEPEQEQRWSGYHPKTRNILRKCAKMLEFRSSDDIAMFEKLYSETMVKNQADDFYLFDRTYFDALLAMDEVRLYAVSCDGRVIAMAFILRGEEMAHYHLSANATNSLRSNGNYYLLDQAFEEMRKEGAVRFLLGGGRSSDPEDTLLSFKRKFSQNAARFHIAGMIHDEAKYREYVGWWESLNPASTVRYFLKYRLKGA